MPTATAVKKYSLAIDSQGNITGETKHRIRQDEAGRQLTRMAKRCAFERRCSFTEALREVMTDPDHETLVRAYQATPPPIDDGLTDASLEADKRARQRMTEKGEKDYPKAVRHVLNADADLKRAYARTYQV